MARAGRKRKPAVPRYKNGSVKKATSNDRREDIRRVVMAQRLRLVPHEQVFDQMAECPLGIYALRTDITPEEYQAGLDYAKLVYRVRRDYDAPRPDAKSNYPNEMIGGGVRDPDILLTDEQLQEERKARLARRRDYNDAFEALQGAGIGANRAVNRVAIHGRFIDDNDMSTTISILKLGLAALAQHFASRTSRRP